MTTVMSNAVDKYKQWNDKHQHFGTSKSAHYKLTTKGKM
jgi:hypothetical protein